MKNIKKILLIFISIIILTSNCHAQAKPDMPIGDYEKAFGHLILGIRYDHSKEMPRLLFIKDTVLNSIDTIAFNSAKSISFLSDSYVFDSYLDNEKLFFISVRRSPFPIELSLYEKDNGKWFSEKLVNIIFLFNNVPSALEKYGVGIKIIDRNHILYQKGPLPTKYRIDFEKKTLVEEI